MAASVAPVLSTPAEHIFEDPTPITVPSSEARLSDEQLYLQYEIKRTVSEIRAGKWKRVALQFPDDMLVDAPRVFERLREGLGRGRAHAPGLSEPEVSDVADGVKDVKLDANRREDTAASQSADDTEERLCILADTSYGACCVDEVAAEHVDAEVVVHYGRSCLSPTARLPVIYVYTSKPLDLEAAVASFEQTYPDKSERVCLMADIPYSHHVPALAQRLREEGYTNLFATEVVGDPSSLLPNRTLPQAVQQDPAALKEYSIFHISSPPTSLLLILSSRVKSVHIFPTDTAQPTALEATTAQLLRRRYALITRLSTVPIFGILINTLSVSNYLAALTHCQHLIKRAGKKSYVFVVGKVNAAKVANFSEIGGWVVIGCWESSLIESKEFYRPIITPFELEVALVGDEERVWGGEWVGDFSALLGRDGNVVGGGTGAGREVVEGCGEEELVNGDGAGEGDWGEQDSDDEPPDFDLRTGKYVSHSRPMGRTRPSPAAPTLTADSSDVSTAPPATSSALVQRAAKSDLATVNGAVSPAAEYLRSQRTWQGLGSDLQRIAYERDDEGRIRGAAVEEGRSGVARGYAVGEGDNGARK
ncbi:hypothetical protein LTR36_006323 [Oleoguttula mirabilis]|uniref:2-(3-amino-3-carboxypropyl)histidine synthase subunit 2 n=1 Tax=Oleoguttula mirabilis TaxID=1507867 RepID=A0AAV9JUJ8_9PEZI|nr:hypothetical protein LTR36_006323 [Oleoguttula mirabilis]